MANQQSRVDQQVAQAIKNMLRTTPPRKINQLAEALPSRNAPGRSKALSPTPTIREGNLADRLGFKRANPSKLRSEMTICDIASQRSDAISGQFSCVECGRKLGSLQEAWRKNGDMLSSFSTLFCAPCAMKLNESANLGLAPLQMNNFDKLATGQFVEAFGVVPQTPTPAAPSNAAAESRVARWKNILGS